MEKTISIEVGKGSQAHNSRKFNADNVDGNRTKNNVCYCNESIKKVYHELFDDALKRYNERQTRADRQIKNYYEKIRTGHQEKLFHEIVVQIGNKDDTNVQGEHCELAGKILDEYYSGFIERNPQLRVFSAHLHLDEETPHLHIDFVPFTTGSKRGLDTRVTLKQALAMQGFKGGSKGETEWSQWVQSEKEALADVMKRHGVEWLQLGTKREHLSVLDYKKEQRAKELAELEGKLADKKDEFEVYQDRISNYSKGEKVIEELSKKLDTEPDYQLQEPPPLMSAKNYKTKFVEPLIKKLREVISSVMSMYYQALDSYHRLNITNRNLYRENEHLRKDNVSLSDENKKLKAQNRDYNLLRKVFGSKQIDELLSKAKEPKQSKQRDERFRKNNNYER